MKTGILCRLVGLSLLLLGFITAAHAGPGQPQLDLLQKELLRYTEIQSKGGWSKIVTTKKYLTKGDNLPAVRELKQRLRVAGLFAPADTTALFTPELVEAVKMAQRQFGYKENGVVDALLLRELNLPVEKRVNQLQVNMDRLARFAVVSEGTHLVANIPEFKLHIYEGTKLAFDIDIVVGTESNKTVVFNDTMTYLVFSPSWNVPPSIVRKEILPAMNNDHDYLWRNRYVQTGTESGLPVIKQLPGPKNALGLVKFVFPNSHNIYFHDTPSKSLFELRRRAFSHGCIRLAEPAKLAEYLLRDAPGWSAGNIQLAMESGVEQRVNLPAKVPVSITYFTSWVDDDGLLHFREDIYGLDAREAGSIVRNAP